jgi:8-oxo-dGTP pyrophosphatase MutT (NUDIX family)
LPDQIIKDAATIILVRDVATNPSVLMGQRGANAAFMPNKVVFPGGAVDAGDGSIELAASLAEPCQTRVGGGGVGAQALAVAAIRELWEETGQILGDKTDWQGEIPPDWVSFAQAGYAPSAAALRFVFRAITPPNRPRRFDARFFLADADSLASDADDFSRASDELSHLQWIPFGDVRKFDLPFVTEVVLAEVAKSLPGLDAPARIPFFDNSGEESRFVWLD